MRKIIVNTFSSMDGIIQAPGAPEEDRANGFEYGGWSVTFWDDVMMEVMGKASQTPYDLLLGRRTYEIFAAHWPFTKDAMGKKFTAAKKYVATNTLKSASWENTILLNNFVEDIRKIKAQDGISLQVHGSANLLQTLWKHNLVDELCLWTFPIVLGKGKKLFENGVPSKTFKLTDSRISNSGVIIGTYVPVGDVKLGSFALSEPNAVEIERRKKFASEK